MKDAPLWAVVTAMIAIALVIAMLSGCAGGPGAATVATQTISDAQRACQAQALFNTAAEIGSTLAGVPAAGALASAAAGNFCTWVDKP